jgi:hypothetical protein
VKLKLAFVEVVGLVGALVIEGVGGAVASTVHVEVAAELWFVAASTALTEKVCEPSVSEL